MKTPKRKEYRRRCPSCRKGMVATKDGRGYVLRWACAACNVSIPNLLLDRNDRSQQP